MCARRCRTRSSIAPPRSRLVDTTPDDLLQRLREGKVYVKAQAERALKHFFSPGNLTGVARACPSAHGDARRPRRDRLYAVARHRRAGGGADSRLRQRAPCERRTRTSRQTHRRQFQGALDCSYVEGPRHLSAGRATERPYRRRAASCAAPRRGDRDRARQRLSPKPSSTTRAASNATQIVIGKSSRSRWFEMLNGSVVRELMRDSGTISVTAVAAQGDVVGAKTVATAPRGRHGRLAKLCMELDGLGGHLGVAWVFNANLELAAGSVAMFFLVPVLLSAVVVRAKARLAYFVRKRDGVQFLLSAARSSPSPSPIRTTGCLSPFCSSRP